VAAGLGSTWWQYLLLFLAVAASWAGVPVIGTAALGAAAVAASQRRLDLAAVIVVAVHVRPRSASVVPARPVAG
jgi:hypothetical protein